MNRSPRPVVFIHGLWLHPSSWGPWEELFRERGYRPVAPGWPGVAESVELTRADPSGIAGHGIDDAVAHYARVVDALPEPPVLVGHSFGGVIAQKLLGQNRAAAAVAIDAAQIKGVLPLPLSSLRATFPVFRNPANKHRAVSLTPAQFRFAFGNTVGEQESARLYERWTIPAPGRPLFEAAAANFSRQSPAEVDTRNPDRGPLLLVAGGRDHTVPETITRATLKQYRDSQAVTDLAGFPTRGHSLTIDSGWREVAEASLDWLAKQDLQTGA
ncbi:alpha/beta hydrolase [Streptomyces sp. NPDC059627]